MKIGSLHQHPPKTLRYKKFPPQSSLSEEELPTIAIVTPSYMQGNFLGRTIESVLSQHYPKLRYAVQDGGSKDETVKVIESYASRLAAWESAPDNGQGDAVNRGFQKIEGDVMAWLNSDDTLVPGSLRFVGEYFATHPDVDVIYGNRIIIDAHDKKVGRWILAEHDSELLDWADIVPQETLFWRKAMWEKVGGINPDFKFALDWDFLVRLKKAGAKMVHLPFFIGCFRVHEAQKTSSQMHTVGEEETQKIRRSIHGQDFDPIKYQERMHAFMMKSLRTSYLHSIGIKKWDR